MGIRNRISPAPLFGWQAQARRFEGQRRQRAGDNDCTLRAGSLGHCAKARGLLTSQPAKGDNI